MIDQLNPRSPKHLRKHPTVSQWAIDFWRRKNRRTGEMPSDCSKCGWPHSPQFMCGVGATFGEVYIGGQVCWVDSSNVEYVLNLMLEEIPKIGSHWKNQLFVKREPNEVVVSRIEYFNNTPSIKSIHIPVMEFAELICAASLVGETKDNLEKALIFLRREP